MCSIDFQAADWRRSRIFGCAEFRDDGLLTTFVIPENALNSGMTSFRKKQKTPAVAGVFR
jgi:hypothetical protein